MIIDKMVNIIHSIFSSSLNHITFQVDDREGREDDDYSLILCKNCEEYIEECALGQVYSKSHGKWKSFSSIYKEHIGFSKQLRWREKLYGKPLPLIQKIKAARKVSHDLYPTPKFGGKYGGIKGHNIREKFRKEILKSININYIPRYL